jgi:hypothetical protein
MDNVKITLLCCALLSLTGCSNATLSREDCLRGDWFALGVQDGSLGNTLGEFNLHQQACVEYGITPDRKQYLAGREKGLADYCKLENAVTFGLNGHLYQSVCPKEINEAFRKQNLAAYNLYQTYMRSLYYQNFYGGYGFYGRPFGFSPYRNFGLHHGW